MKTHPREMGRIPEPAHLKKNRDAMRSTQPPSPKGTLASKGSIFHGIPSSSAPLPEGYLTTQNAYELQRKRPGDLP